MMRTGGSSEEWEIELNGSLRTREEELNQNRREGEKAKGKKN